MNERPLVALSLQRHVGVLARQIRQVLAAEDLQVLTNDLSRHGRIQNFVHKAPLSGSQRVGETTCVLFLVFFHVLLVIRVENLHGAFGSHDRQFGTGPSVVGTDREDESQNNGENVENKRNQ